MLSGTIQSVIHEGNLIGLGLQDQAGLSHMVFGDARMMDAFLGAVVREADAEGIHPSKVQIVAEAPGLAGWMALASEVDEESLALAEA